MTSERAPIDTDDLIRRYTAGEPVQRLAARYGVSRKTIARRLDAHGIKRRSHAEAHTLYLASLTPEERQRQIAAAQDAIRGTTRPQKELEHRAKTRERKQLGVSLAEYVLRLWLIDRGVPPERLIPQQAIGPYNVDLGALPVAVEIFGGGWHGYSRHRVRSPQRYRYLLDRGINLVIIWVNANRWPISPKAADYVVAFMERTSSDPTIRGKYRVIWGDGEEVPSGSVDIDHISDVPSRRAAKSARS